MKPARLPSAPGTEEEIAALIEILHSTGQRLEELTAGEVDGVADRDGRTFLLRHAQEQLRDSEAAKQASILDALPAHVALLDTWGTIISVNRGWRAFASANALQGPQYAIGVNYLDICDSVRGGDAAEARQAAAGIRAVLAGTAHDFSAEYPCHSPTQQRWFLMTVTPLAPSHSTGAVVMHLDMTSTRLADESRRNAELKFRQMAESIRDVFFLMDAASERMVYVSPAYAEIWGRSCASLHADPESWAAAIHPDDRAAADADYRKGISTGKFESEYRILRPGGAIRWIEARGFPVRDAAGKLVRIAGIATDISERRQAEDALRESKDLLQLVVEHVPSRIFWKDRDLRYMGCNTRFARDAGLSTPEELSGKTDFEMGWKDQAELYRADDKAVLTAGAPRLDIEEPQTTPDGNTIWLRTSKVPLRNKDDRIIGILGLYQDVTARRRAEQDLRESERRFSDVLANVELISVMLDTDARITYCNDYMLRLSGWTAEEVIGGNWFDLFVPPENVELKASFFPALLADRPEVRHHDNEILTRLGERRLIRWNNSVLRSANGDVTGIASIGEDITQQRRAEAGILRLNRVYAVQSGINALIVHVRDRDELFREACRIAVEAGAFKTAWIGVIDPQTLDGKILAWYGADQSYVDTIKLAPRNATSDSEPPACRALRQGQTVICNDIATEASLAPRKDVLLRRGYKSLGCFPLMLGGRPEAVIALFAGEPDYFDAEEVRLLVDLAVNLSFALDNLEQEKTLKAIDAQRQRGEESLRRFSSAMDATADAIYLVDRTSMRFIHVNDAACRMQDIGREALLTLKPWELLETSRGELEHAYDAIIARGADAEPLELLHQRKDGSQIWVELRRHAQRAGDCWTIITLVRDITERKRAIEELRESESRFRSLTALSTDWYWQQDEALRFVAFSGGENIDGWDNDQRTWVGLQRWEIPGIRPLTASWNEHRAVLRAHQPFRNLEYQRQDADGSLRYVAASGEPIFDAGGGFAGYRGVATDITERKAAESRIRRLNRVYAVLSGINTLIVRVRDRDELFREACRIAVDTGGFRMSMLCIVDHGAMKIVPVASAGKDDSLLAAVKGILSSAESASISMVGRAIAEKVAIVSNDLRNDPQLLLAKHYRDAEVRSLVVLPLVAADVAAGALVLYSDEIDFFDEEEIKLLTELAGDIGFAIDHIEKRERIDYLAYYDVLTGLANRNLFVDRVAQYIHGAENGGHQLAVILIDLERFKNINDSLGQVAGDSLLKQVATWLARSAGDANLIARIGADHYAAVLPEVRPDGDVTRLIEKTLAAFLDHPFHLNDAVFRVAVKIGIAVFPDDGADAETLFRNAEAALKQAKTRGERYLFYAQQMNASVAVRVTLENQLRQALDNQEFVLHYQPKVNLASGKLTGAEALIRWNDPRTGLVPPGHFIPILEETGLIYEVGRWALRQAIADYLRWRAAGLPAVRIAVNVSPLQLRNRGFIAEIGRVIAVDEHAAAGLELEITESVIMEDVKHNIASLQAIRDFGIGIAIDDFGTGFSSLSYLAKLPVDTLKIDRSFVIEMTAGPQGLALVSTVIALAHSLKLKVVAEGVETEEQQHLLHLLDCDEMQGFLFSKPLPAEIFEARFLVAEVRA